MSALTTSVQHSQCLCRLHVSCLQRSMLSSQRRARSALRLPQLCAEGLVLLAQSLNHSLLGSNASLPDLLCS